MAVEIIQVFNVNTEHTPHNESWFVLWTRDKQGDKILHRIIDWNIKREHNQKLRTQAKNVAMGFRKNQKRVGGIINVDPKCD